LAHSPDADDIFMYYAIKFGWVDVKDYNFSNSALDIETLNREALRGIYEVTAISFGLYPQIWDDYALLRTATSFGDGYGPKIIKKRGRRLKPNFRVAISGEVYRQMVCSLRTITTPRLEVNPNMNFLDIGGCCPRVGWLMPGVLILESNP